MKEVPPEICGSIFALACVDTGATARSLSLVSKFISETSRPYRFQSISLHGLEEITSFLDLLNQTEPALRQVRYLFVSTQPRAEDSSASPRQLEDGEEPYAAPIENLLRLVAPHVEVLELDLDLHSFRSMQAVIAFPCLTDLTCCGSYPLSEDDHKPLISPCHSLKRIHLRMSWDTPMNSFFQHLTKLAPNLTHLLFSNLRDAWVLSRMSVALGLEEPSVHGQVSPLPSSLKHILLRPGNPPLMKCSKSRRTLGTLYNAAQDLEDRDSRVKLLPAEFDKRYKSPISEDDWLDTISGGAGCWSTETESDLSGYWPQ